MTPIEILKARKKTLESYDPNKIHSEIQGQIIAIAAAIERLNSKDENLPRIIGTVSIDFTR